MSNIETAVETERRDRKTSLRFGLAAVAVLGIGAAVTSASWTDQAWFTGSAGAAQVELQASTDGTSWVDADTVGDGVAVAIDEAAFARMNQGETRQVTLHLKNSGSVDLSLGGQAEVSATGSLFEGSDPASATVSVPDDVLLSPAETTTATLTITTPEDWDPSYQGAAGALTVSFTGVSQA
ncbi:SipW-dependent-type signal peptide-containing protein [Cellulosimicrobium funkei]